MKVGDTFESWEQFKKQLTEYRNSTFQPLFVNKQVRTVEYANSISKDCEGFKPELKYSTVDIQCIHFGHYLSRAKEVVKKHFHLCS